MESPIVDLDDYRSRVQLILGYHIDRARRKEEEAEFEERFRYNQIAQKLKEISEEIANLDVARCEVCGYTEEDKAIHGDHHLCSSELNKEV